MKFIRFIFLIILISNIVQAQEVDNSKVNELDWWLQKNNDTLPGTNLQEAYHYITDKKGTYYPVTVAVLDTDIDINHKDIQPVLWRNTKETINDHLDNDNNGYIDDINGWNFLGTKKDGRSLKFTLMEETRILQKYTKEQLTKLYRKKKIPYSYERVRKSYDTIVKNLTNDITYYQDIQYTYASVLDTLRKVSNADKITLEALQNWKTEDSYIRQCVDYAKSLLEQGFPYTEIVNDLGYYKKSLEICMNLAYDNRILVGDDTEDMCDINYGSGLFGGITDSMNHGTKVAGVIASALKSMNGIHKKSLALEIMPLCITGIGDPSDKDTALAIRYAVDNGAKIINLSQTKTFSLHQKFVKKALKYAEKKDVLIVKSAGNEGLNLDREIRYPNDTDTSGKEFVKNMLVVGGTTKYTDIRILDEDSNYGTYNVDIFAPSIDIHTLLPNNEYTTASGTSYAAPIVASIAALIRSYFPKLSAKQVKQILMDSGTSYAIEVEIKREDGTKKLVPFSELSKSGKVVNAYNALLLAEKVSKGKKGN